jgi:hypothetical protein
MNSFNERGGAALKEELEAELSGRAGRRWKLQAAELIKQKPEKIEIYLQQQVYSRV